MFPLFIRQHDDTKQLVVLHLLRPISRYTLSLCEMSLEKGISLIEYLSVCVLKRGGGRECLLVCVTGRNA